MRGYVVKLSLKETLRSLFSIPWAQFFFIENFSTWKAFLNQLSNGQDFLGHFYFQEFEQSHEDFHKFH